MIDTNAAAEPCFFYDGFVVEKDYVILASKLERWRYDDYFHGRIFFFDGEWIRHDIDWQVESACLLPAGPGHPKRTYCFLGLHSGLVQWYEGGGAVIRDEPLPPGAEQMRQIRLIGDTLFACGQQSQVYRRDPQGWVPFNANLEGRDATADLARKLQGAKQPAPQSEADREQYATNAYEAIKDFSAQVRQLNSIAGFSEQELYVAGDLGFVARYEPAGGWRTIPTGTNSQLNWVECVGHDEVYVCGNDGRLMKGGAAGFDMIPSDTDDDLLCVHRFGGRLYLAGGKGLYVVENNLVKPLDIGLGQFEANRLDSRDGQLWSFGAKKISCFDGEAWRHFDHPDNV